MVLSQPVIKKTAEDWTPEAIANFWDYYSAKPQVQDNYFSYQVRTGLMKLLQFTGRLQGAVLDYGCGPGYLLEYLLQNRHLQCYGADTSNESVAIINQKFAGLPNWKQAVVIGQPPTKYPTGFFDVITCLETVEHLSDDVLTALLDEVRRLVKPDGMVLFTTPNDEDLSSATTYCPFCGSEFHCMQHMRSFSAESLRRLLEHHHFEVVFCQGISLEKFQDTFSLPSWKYMGIAHVYKQGVYAVQRGRDRVAPRRFPHGREFQARIVPGRNLCAVAVPN